MKFRKIAVCVPCFLVCTWLEAAPYASRIASAGQPIPGAVVTAVSGDRKLTTSSGTDGRFELDLEPGDWKVTVEMFGFERIERTVTAGAQPAEPWSLTLKAFPRQGAAGPGARGFQNVDLNRTGDELPTLPPPAPADSQVDTGESFLVNGSMSRGLAAPQEIDMFAGGMPMMGGPRPDGTGNPFGGSEESRAPGSPGGGPGGMGPGGMGPGGPGGRGGFGGSGGGFGGGSGGRFGRPGGPDGGRFERREGGPRDRRAGAGPRSPDVFGNRRQTNRPNLRGMLSLQAGNSAFDARPYSLTGQTFDKPGYSQTRFGFMLGGQLRIPKILERSRTNFILQYNGALSSNSYTAFATVPTALERAGDFSQSIARGPVTIYDPATNAPFPGNRIPASRISSIAGGLLRFIPEPNAPGSVQNYQLITSIPRNSHGFMLRVNQGLNARDRLAVGFNLQTRDAENVQLYGFRDTSSSLGYSTDLTWIRNLKAGKVNNLRFRFNRERSDALPYFAYGEDVAGALGILGPSRDPINFGPPNLNFTNFGDLTDGSPLLRRNQTLGVSEELSIVHGRHTVSFGGEVRRVHLDLNSDQNARGSFAVTGLGTSGFDAAGQPLRNTGYDFADFLLGVPQSSTIRFSSQDTYFRNWAYSAYWQDDWRARPNLTINAGVRYELLMPYTERYGHLANLDIAPGFTGVAVVTPGMTPPYSGKLPDGLVRPDANNVAPRFGFAWRPWQKSRFQVRGGYSQFYDGSAYGNIANRLAAQPPFANTATINTSLANPLTLADGFPLPASDKIANTFAVNPDYLVAYAQTWNLALQHEFAGMVIEAGYLGTKGTRLDILRLPNRAAPGSPLTAEERRQIGDAVGFTYSSSEGSSILHAGQLRVMRRLRHGVSFNALYTWSKSIDNASSVSGIGSLVSQNDRDLRAERGLSIFDQRHALTLNSLFATTTQRSLLRNWTMSWSATLRSGHPFTARVLGNAADAGGTGAVGTARADSTGLPVTAGNGFFNPLAFSVPLPGTFGNASRGTIPGTSFFTLNVSVGRSFRLGSERQRLEIRAQADNLTNRVNYTNFATIVNASNFGLATAAGPMRSISLSLRYRF